MTLPGHGYPVHVFMHTHPPRYKSIGTTCDSIEESDIGLHYRVKFEPVGISRYEKQLHWLCWLAESARSGQQYVLRLEDDIVVNKHILHNLMTWSALQDPEFGVGVCMVGRASKVQCKKNKFGFKRTEAMTRFAQGHLYHAESLAEAIKHYWDVIAAKGYRGGKVDQAFSWYDTGITGAYGRIGRAVYLHKPSLVDCSEVATVEALGAFRLGSKIMETKQRELKQIPHRAPDFDPDWRRRP